MTLAEGTRLRTIAWTDPARTRFQLRGRDGYEQLAAMHRGEAAPPPAVAALGMAFDALERGRTVFSIVADEMHENPMGTMHGGILATLVDTAMGYALVSTLPAGCAFTTLTLSTQFVRPVTTSTGRVYAEGRVVHGGHRVATTDAHVYDDAGVAYAHATATCLIVRNEP